MDKDDVLKILADGGSLQGAQLAYADLRGIDLSNVDMRGTDLRGANLQGANLAGACLEGACLIRADLRSADLMRAYLMSADLRKANLEKANLEEAFLARADLSGANLRDVDLSSAHQLAEAEGSQFVVFKIGMDLAMFAGGYGRIGCERHSYDEWLERGEEIGVSNGYSDADIQRYMRWIRDAVEYLREQEKA